MLIVDNDILNSEGLKYSSRRILGYDFQECQELPDDASKISLIADSPSQWGIIYVPERGSRAGNMFRSIIESGLVPVHIKYLVLSCDSEQVGEDDILWESLLDTGAAIVYCDGVPNVDGMIPSQWFQCPARDYSAMRIEYHGDVVTPQIERAMWKEFSAGFWHQVFELTGCHFDEAKNAEKTIEVLTCGKVDCPRELVNMRKTQSPFIADWKTVVPQAYAKACLLEDIAVLWNNVSDEHDVTIECLEANDEIFAFYKFAAERWGIEYMIDAMLSGTPVEYVSPGSDYYSGVNQHGFQEKYRDRSVPSFAF